jgi:hypothetical protein
MRRVILFVLSLAIVADHSLAQGGMGRRGGGMGGRRAGGGGREGRAAEMVLADAGEFRKLNPAGLMVDNRKKLALNDSQYAALTVMRDRSRDGNASILAHYDSVRKEVRELINNRRDRRQQAQEPDSAQGEGMQSMRTLRFLLDTLATRRANDVREVLEFIKDEKQHRTAVELLNDQDLTFQEKLPRLGGGRGRRGGESRPSRD